MSAVFSAPLSCERWGLYEIVLPGPRTGNPFTEQSLSAVFTGEDETVTVRGFYDGDGVYRVRFMPSHEGAYRWKLTASFPVPAEEGPFLVTSPAEGNHGPVHVQNSFHFAYADGAPYAPVGTTCYVWHLQSDDLISQTLDSLRLSGFNKIRFCVFPKHYLYNLHDPRSFPYEGTPVDCRLLNEENFNDFNGAAPGNDWDFTRFNTDYFHHLESCVLALQSLGIEADLIIMHPYDRWGFSRMSPSENDLYWHYLIARLSAFRNVWWSLANEYDLLPAMKEEDWERLANTLVKEDPYGHLRSIHNCFAFYDFTRSWVTHCCIQRQDLYRTAEYTGEWRERFGKPTVLDEIAYEGDIPCGWGNITGEEMVRRFWEAAVRGGYPGHGETLPEGGKVLWWSHGGPLRGESWKRVRFLKQILAETPGIGLAPFRGEWDDVEAIPEDATEAARTGYHLYYFSFMRPSVRDFRFDDGRARRVEVIDTWNMTVEDRGTFSGRFRVSLPSRPYMAIRIRFADEKEA